jgi:hypothetical protein
MTVTDSPTSNSTTGAAPADALASAAGACLAVVAVFDLAFGKGVLAVFGE